MALPPRSRTFSDATVVRRRTAASTPLIGLTIDGAEGAAPNGVKLVSGGALAVKNCLVRNFFGSGIVFLPTATTNFLIEDTTLTGLGWDGVPVMATPGGSSANGRINRVTVSGAKWAGVEVGWSNHVSIAESSAVNSEIGFAASGNSRLMLAHSFATENKTGVVRFTAAATIESAGDNTIRDNVTNVQGAMSMVGMQ